MKINKAEHRVVLLNLFIVTLPGQPPTSRNVPLEDLKEASSIKKKLMKDSKEIKGPNGQVIETELSKKVIEFDTAEVKLLNKWFDTTAQWNVNDADSVLEVKELLK